MSEFKFINLHDPLVSLQKIPLTDGTPLTIRELLVNNNVPLDHNHMNVNKKHCCDLDRIICAGDLITCCSNKLRGI